MPIRTSNMSASTLRWAVGGWSFFIAENVIISHNRTEIIEAFGNDAYHAAYNTLSKAATAAIGWGWFKHVRVQKLLCCRRSTSTPAMLLRLLGEIDVTG